MNAPRRRDVLAWMLSLASLGACSSFRLSKRARRAFATSLRIAFPTDVHARAVGSVSQALTQAALAVNERRPDLVLAGGDLIDSEVASPGVANPQWETYLAMHEAIHAPIYPAIGNKDLVAGVDPKASFRERLELDRTYYSFDADGYHFVILDSIHVTGDELGYEGRIDAQQVHWLREDLTKVSETTPIIVVSHIPLASAFFALTQGATSSAPRNRVVVNNRQVLELLDSHNLLLVLQGHLHVRETLQWKGTTFLTGGAICGSWWNGPHHGAEEGFYVLTLRGRQIELDYVDYGWEVKSRTS